MLITLLYDVTSCQDDNSEDEIDNATNDQENKVNFFKVKYFNFIQCLAITQSFVNFNKSRKSIILNQIIGSRKGRIF